MVILVDTNILMDVIADRKPYAEYGKEILEMCAKRQVIGIIAAHSIPNLFYILRKDFSQEERRALLRNLCKIFRISDLNMKKYWQHWTMMNFWILRIAYRKNAQLKNQQILL